MIAETWEQEELCSRLDRCLMLLFSLGVVPEEIEWNIKTDINEMRDRLKLVDKKDKT